jgi:hypothetical protein
MATLVVGDGRAEAALHADSRLAAHESLPLFDFTEST